MSLLATFEKVAAWAHSELTPDHVQQVFNVLKADLGTAQAFVQQLQAIHGPALIQTPLNTKPSAN
jgi:hypothetical protein